MRIRKMPWALACTLTVLLVAPAAALAHAQLVGTVPLAGTTLTAQPPLVVFEYNEPVGFTLGAVRVYDAKGNEVDDSHVVHPAGSVSKLGVGLKRGLSAGTYTATYTVISADTHVVTGGLVFDIGYPSPSSLSVGSLTARNKAGEVTLIALSVVRGLDYVSLALAIGPLALLWLAMARTPDAVSRILRKRVERLLAIAIGLGILTGEFGILLEGASAAGVSLWSSLRADIVRSVLESRFGWVWGSRTIVWIVLGLLLAATAGARRARERTARVAELPPVAVRLIGGLACVYLAITPGLSSHPAVQSPVAVLLPADAIHVFAVAIWVGGITALLFALPRAVRELEPPARTPVLVAVLSRFSLVALICAIAIAITGGVQALVLVRTLHALTATAYGRAILIKVILFCVLIGFGVLHRRRIIPGLEALARAGSTPGAVGALLRRTFRREGLTMFGVFGVTAALISYTPPVDVNAGPFSLTTTIGPAQLELTVDPASAGANTIHLYLIDAKTGAQFTQTKTLDVTASLPAKRIGPLALKANVSGPGHYTLNAVTLAPGGAWRLQITDRVSDFDEYVKTIDVPIH